MEPTYTAHAWLTSPLGQYALACEQAFYDRAVADLFGFNLVQVGWPQVDLGRNCRIPQRLIAAEESAVSVRCRAQDLPFAAHSVDVLLLPHVLEYAESPHDALREAERILLPEGHLVLSGFNPLSLWGTRRLLPGKKEYPWHGHFIPLPRIKDWLALLGFEIVGGRAGCYLPPFRSGRWLQRCASMDQAGDRWWPMLGGMYFLVAKKRVAGMRVIRPAWGKQRFVRSWLPKPTQKTLEQRIKHAEKC